MLPGKCVQTFDLNDLLNLHSYVEAIKSKVKSEMEANLIASSSKHSWKTVRQYQNNSISKRSM